MVIFNSDIDNTLIYSYKKDIGNDKKCVEIYENREISYMSKKSIDMLEKISNKICFVPTTTRTEQQYKRIFFSQYVNIKYALVCNGGILLENGVVDDKWYEESMDIIKNSIYDIECSKELLKHDEYRNFDVKNINDLFLFTKSSKPYETIEYIKKNITSDETDIFNNGNKIFVVPKTLNKGNAVKRLKNKLNGKYVISAGDSIFDIPMSISSDICFLPNSVKNEIENITDKMVLFDDNKLFSEYILEYILEKLIL